MLPPSPACAAASPPLPQHGPPAQPWVQPSGHPQGPRGHPGTHTPRPQATYKSHLCGGCPPGGTQRPGPLTLCPWPPPRPGTPRYVFPLPPTHRTFHFSAVSFCRVLSVAHLLLLGPSPRPSLAGHLVTVLFSDAPFLRCEVLPFSECFPQSLTSHLSQVLQWCRAGLWGPDLLGWNPGSCSGCLNICESLNLSEPQTAPVPSGGTGTTPVCGQAQARCQHSGLGMLAAGL